MSFLLYLFYCILSGLSSTENLLNRTLIRIILWGIAIFTSLYLMMTVSWHASFFSTSFILLIILLKLLCQWPTCWWVSTCLPSQSRTCATVKCIINIRTNGPHHWAALWSALSLWLPPRFVDSPRPPKRNLLNLVSLNVCLTLIIYLLAGLFAPFGFYVNGTVPMYSFTLWLH